jgi:hypothetical protein
MNLPTRPHPSHVPTLTEVIEFGADESNTLVVAPALAPLVPMPVLAPEPPVIEPPAVPEISEAQLSQRVLTDVQRQIDSMLEFRLRESMQPLLAQFTETLMQDLRDELSRTMRDVVTRAVAQEVAKLRNR